MHRVVVTGVGAVSPCGKDASSSWDAVCHARSGIGPITHFDASDWAVRIAAEVQGFDPTPNATTKALKRMDRFTQFAVVASDEALLDAGLEAPLGERAGVYIGSGIGGIREIAEGAERMNSRGVRALGSLFIPKSLSNLAAGTVAMRLGAQGPSLCISTACAAGNHSIGEAYRSIQVGAADVMLAGGAEAAIIPLGLGGFMVMRALSRRNDDPTTASRPFDRDRDGFVMGEGAGLLVLERLEHALDRGARIYAEMIGYAHTNDAHHISAPTPRHAGAARCMGLALQSAGIDGREVDYINAHGTSTPHNDIQECQAIRDLFGRHADALLVSSTKGCTGHLLGAAGGLEGVFTVLALHHGRVPPTANIQNLDSSCDINVVPDQAKDVGLDVAMSNAFGFGGTNASLIFRRWRGE
jgi:3-oxoacyl-[acyl-carrier-protein] synthase II